MQKVFFLVTLFLLTNIQSNQAQNLIPASMPNAYIDYVYSADKVKVVNEIYNDDAVKVSFPPNVNGQKQKTDLDVYYAEDNNIKFDAKPLIIFAPVAAKTKMYIATSRKTWHDVVMWWLLLIFAEA